MSNSPRPIASKSGTTFFIREITPGWAEVLDFVLDMRKASKLSKQDAATAREDPE
jgi:hypothetical protein